jgi:hydrophobe/amphiphile efflux-1 (HAE1) family protein
MISRFFIDRPIFAGVLSILIVLGGLISIYTLPIAQFPEIAPPTVEIVASYPGANAETVAQSLASPIEQELSGIKDLIYYQSQSANDGTLRVTLTFEIGSDLDIAAVETQNRLKRAEPRLPQEAVRQGITINKVSSNMLMVAALRSDDPQYNELYLSNYATIYMLDRLKRVPGTGDVSVFGAKDYSMRIWLDPDRMSAKNLTVTEVAEAIREQNGLYAAGRIGGPPNPNLIEFTIPVITRGRFENASDFENIILRAESNGSLLKIKDIGRVELGAQGYDMAGRLNGKPTTFMLINQQPGANALSTVKGVIAALDELSKSFPHGVRYEIPYNTTKFIDVSIDEVVKTLLEAILLVLFVVYIFLGSWRATLIPLLAVPVALIGSFIGMKALGFSINSLTLFGLVLAIGIVVDDAIVVVENVERIMHDELLAVREATIKAMEQVTGPVIAIVLVLSAVFLPVAFLGGLTGEMYRQFAVTIAISVAISGFVALTLSPALCRLLLAHQHNKIFYLRWFDAAFERVTRGYTRMVRMTIKLSVLGLIIFGILVWAAAGLFKKVPSGFIPEEDQGFFIVMTMLPPGSSIERTVHLISEVENWLMKQPEVQDVVSLGGMDFLAGGASSSSAGVMFVGLKTWDERQGPGQDVAAMVGKTFGQFMGHKDGMVLAFNMPAVSGLGSRAGFEFQIQSRGVGDVRQLVAVTDKFLAEANQHPAITGVSGTINVGQPQLYIDLDRERAKTLGLPINSIYDTLQAYLGDLYVNDFNKFGRVYRVQLSAEPQFRSQPDDIKKIYVRNAQGEMVPLSGVLNLRFQSGPNIVSRFNSYPSVQITGAPQPGRSTGEAMDALKQIAAKVLPAGYGYEWSGASYQEIKAGNQAPLIMAFGLLVVFLVLAAQYERWGLPLAVLLAVPIGVFGAILAVYLRGIDRDIYFQIGLLTLIGLSSKNAILIVEFCSVLHEQGMPVVQAAVEAAKLRLRPIIMTSLAFILGVLPLVISHGAGAAGRHSIGTGVMGGMIAATFLSIFLVPMFFVIIVWLTEWPKRRRLARQSTPPPPPVETPQI